MRYHPIMYTINRSLKGVCMLLLLAMTAFAQQPVPEASRKYTLKDVVNIAREKSIASLQAATLKENYYWQWRYFLSNYKPQLTLNATFPDFSKTNTPVIQPDGTTKFQSLSINNLTANLFLAQSIGATGGTVFLNTELLRFDDFLGNTTRYNAKPIVIGINQPIFMFNSLKWDRKIEPLRFEESRKKYVEDMETVSVNAVGLFFELLLAQNSYEIARTNLANNDTIYKIAEVRFGLGRISQNDLLQLKLSVLKSKKALAQAELELETNTLRLKNFIGLSDNDKVGLYLPLDIPVFQVDEQKAIIEARQNRQESLTFERQLLEAGRDVAKAIGDNGININVAGTFGLTSRADVINKLYGDPRDQSTFKVGVQFPVLDWGRARSKIKTAQANKKLIEYTVAQQRINFDQEIYTLVKQFAVLNNQLLLTKEADVTAEARYTISKNLYLAGAMGITDLNIALEEKDIAKKEYVGSLRNFWTAYYNLRLLTLYDFEKQENIRIKQ
jgi:outer membrane protein